MLYYYTRSEHAVSNIKKRRIKISDIRKLNDPFEMSPALTVNPDANRALKLLKAELCKRIGFISFSRRWDSNVMWGHYGERHSGVCLGFDYVGLPIRLHEVRYDLPRVHIEGELILRTEAASTAALLGIEFKKDDCETEFRDRFLESIQRKHSDWSYEEEVRMVCRLRPENEKDGLYFERIEDSLELREIILGTKCDRQSDLLSAAEAFPNVSIYRAILDRRNFEITRLQIQQK